MLKIYWDESIDNCNKCALKDLCCEKLKDGACGPIGSYQIKDVPEETEPKPEHETEYEWKKKQYELLNRMTYHSSEIMSEIGNLYIWLNKNKTEPEEKWETCTRENTTTTTAIGSGVRCRRTCRIFTLKYVSNNKNLFVLSDRHGMDFNTFCPMSDYEINTAKDK